MRETPEFALEFCKIALLANVGRINTTMACGLVSRGIVRVLSLLNFDQSSPR